MATTSSDSDDTEDNDDSSCDEEDVAKFMAFSNSHKRDNKVKVVEESPLSLNDCENSYFTFPVSYHEDAQAFTKILEGPKNGDLKSEDKRGARLREAIIEDMSHESSS